MAAGALAAGAFQDIPDDAWYADAVSFVYGRGVMNGMSEELFEPNRELTRAMMVQILYNLEGRPGAGSPLFPDVSDSAWYADAVAWAADGGIVYGFQDGTFGPNKPITREQMTTILYRYTGDYNGRDVSGLGDLAAFADADQIGSYALDAMSWAVASGYIRGMGDDLLAPKGTATRAQVAQLFMNYLDTGAATPSDLEDPGEDPDDPVGEEPVGEEPGETTGEDETGADAGAQETGETAGEAGQAEEYQGELAEESPEILSADGSEDVFAIETWDDTEEFPEE